MAKKDNKTFTLEKADLKKFSRSEQRRFLDLGLVKGEAAPVEAPKADKPAK